jgi:hypothetical protein
MTPISATFPANQWPAQSFYQEIDTTAALLAAYAFTSKVGSTDEKIHRDVIIKGMTLMLAAGNA